MAFIIRVQTPKGIKRLLFQNDSRTFEDLQIQLADVSGVSIPNQKLSLTPWANPKILAPAKTIKLQQIPLRHGDMLYLKDNTPAPAATDSSSSSSSSSQSSNVKLTVRCQHGPNGRCIHCLGPVTDASKAPIKCTHDAGTTCINCSSYVNNPDTKENLADWLCTHPEGAFCPKCIPKEAPSEDGEQKISSFLKCNCDHSKGQMCVVCVDKGPKIKANFVPYAFYMAERKALCHFNHPPTQVCASCAPPKMEDYKGKPNCNKGHLPWPYGVCLSCQPPNAILRLQRYRHVDRVSFQDTHAIQTFRNEWQMLGFHKQMAGILFGRYEEEHESLGGIRANVYAIYEPPQDKLENGVRLLRDVNEQVVQEVASKFNLEPVGWVITSQPRGGEKYGGTIFLSGAEIRQAASFQNKYKNDLGHSRFVTVVVQPEEPFAYQVSDQCVALERDKVLADAEDPLMISTHKPEKNEIVPTVIYKDKPLLPGTPFLTDELVVKVNIMQPKNPQPIFRHHSFTPSGTKHHLVAMLAQYKNEPMHQRFSDFILLCRLSHILPAKLASRVVEAVAANQPFPQSLVQEIERAL